MFQKAHSPRLLRFLSLFKGLSSLSWSSRFARLPPTIPFRKKVERTRRKTKQVAKSRYNNEMNRKRAERHWENGKSKPFIRKHRLSWKTASSGNSGNSYFWLRTRYNCKIKLVPEFQAFSTPSNPSLAPFADFSSLSLPVLAGLCRLLSLFDRSRQSSLPAAILKSTVRKCNFPACYRESEENAKKTTARREIEKSLQLFLNCSASKNSSSFRCFFLRWNKDSLFNPDSDL